MGKLIKSNASLTSDMEEIHNKSIHFQANGNQIFKVATKSWDYGEIWQESYAVLNITGCSNTSSSQSGTCVIRAQSSTSSDVKLCSIEFLSSLTGLSANNFYIEYKNATQEGEQTVVNFFIVANYNSAFQIDVISNTGWSILIEPEIVEAIPTEGYTGKYSNVLNDKSVITAKLITNNQVMETTTEQIRFNTHVKSGNKLSFSDYKVKIGPGVSQVLISGVVSFQWDSPVTSNGLIAFRKNDSEFLRVNGSKPDASMSTSTTCPPFLLSVSEGDVITAMIFGGVGLILQQQRTFMTVEVVG